MNKEERDKMVAKEENKLVVDKCIKNESNGCFIMHDEPQTLCRFVSVELKCPTPSFGPAVLGRL